MTPIPKKVELNNRIINALNILTIVGYYNEDLGETSKKQVIRAIQVLTGRSTGEINE